MSEFLQAFFSGSALGAAYALTALGFVAIYRASQVFNFAHGEFLVFGAFLMTTLHGVGLPWPFALATTMALTGLLAASVERLVLRPLVGRPVFVTVILTIFIGLLLRELIHGIWGTDIRGMPTPWERTGTVTVGGAGVYWNDIAALLATICALALFFLIMQKTRLGVAMRATNNDQEVALALGIPVGRVFGATWFIAGALAGLAGVFLSLFPKNVSSEIGFIALRAFPAVIVGGLESPLGAVIAGFALGIGQELSKTYLNTHLGEFGQNFDLVLPYAFMIVFLYFRPHGLFGIRDVERV